VPETQREYTNTTGIKHSIQIGSSGVEAGFARQRRVWDMRLHQRPPNNKTAILNPGHHRARLEKVKRDPHARPREQSSLAGDGHTPCFDVRHDQNYWQLERRTMVIAVGRCVSNGNQRRCEDLASKNWKKWKSDQNIHHLRHSTDQSLPQLDVLCWVFMLEQKK
jgi:hypothetical protein